MTAPLNDDDTEHASPSDAAGPYGPVVSFGPQDGSLAEALWRLPEGAHVQLAPGQYRGPLVFPEDVCLEAVGGLGSVTIAGTQGATISTEGAARVHLINLMLKGPARGFGAVVQVYQQADVLLDGCVITGGRGRGEGGGGVDLQAGRVRLRRCRLTQNVALQGGAIRASGTVRLEASNCVFADSRVEGAGGGAVFATFGASINLLGCTFTGNRGRIGSSILAVGTLGAEVELACCLLAQDEGGLCLATQGDGRLSIRHSVVPALADNVSAGINVDESVRLRGVGLNRSGDVPYSPMFPVILREIGDEDRFAEDERADVYGRSRRAVWVGAVA